MIDEFNNALYFTVKFDKCFLCAFIISTIQFIIIIFKYLDTDDWTKYYFFFLYGKILLLKINIKQKITIRNNDRMYKKLYVTKHLMVKY